MKKLLVFGFCAAVLMGFGCALTDYGVIVDNNQGVVNTHGKAHVIQGIQTATIWPDGADNLQWSVDQQASGDATLSTTNFHSDYFGGENPFVDQKYCTPDWGGCSIATAQDTPARPFPSFDYNPNPNCFGFRSLSLLVASSRYYGECGRTAVTDRTTKLLALANDMTPVQLNGATWLKGNLNALNTSIVLNNKNGSVFALPITSQIGVTVNLAQRKMLVDMTNPNNRNLLQSAINWNNAHPGPYVGVTMTINGTALNYDVKGTKGLSHFVNDHY
jgi:hypothetical protein